ncbi:hypothetical protein ABZT17_40210 [Streptomyces sp. NPDC005648]|uniref:hypothetical protein n=1 Tax=Streptomyces sp. NPDC005648 TaxID=3157044 RepID=UPI00339F1B08
MSDSETVPPATAPEAPGSAPALPHEALEASGYAVTGPALDLGAAGCGRPLAEGAAGAVVLRRRSG